MSKTRFFRGTVVEEGADPPVGLAGLRVELRAVGARGAHLVATSITDDNGAFALALNELPRAGAIRGFSLSVFLGSRLAALTVHGTTRWPARVHPGPIVLCAELPNSCSAPADPPPTPSAGEDRVYGRVRHRDGTPVVGVTVRLYELGLTSSEPDVATTTGSGGWYELYPTNPSVDFLLKVEVGTDPVELLATSRPCYTPALPIRLDLPVNDRRYRKPSEYAQVAAQVAPHLGELEPYQLQPRSVAIIAGKSGSDLGRTGMYGLAHAIGHRLSVEPELVYGLLRLGWPKRPKALLARAPAAIAAGLQKAAAQNFIGLVDTSTIDAFLAGLVAARKAAHAGEGSASLGAVLATSGELNSAQITTFIGEYVDKESEAAFWAGLPDAEGFNTTLANAAKRLVAIGHVAFMYAPAVASILVELDGAPAAAVADFSESTWATITSEARLADLPPWLADNETARGTLARMMREHVEELYSARRARTRIVTDMPGGHPLEDGKTFMSANTGFDISTSDPHDVAFDGTAPQRKAAATLQRLYRVASPAGRAEAILALGNHGFTSAHSIVRIGRARFLAKVAEDLDADAARALFARAQRRHANTLTAFLQFHPRFATPGFAFLPEE